MGGIRKLRKIQLGVEETAGTNVAATTVWRGTGTIQDDIEVTSRNEDVGYLSEVDNSYVPTTLATLELEPTEATFEQLPYILNMGNESEAGAKDGAGNGYVYTHDLATTAQKTPLTYSFEGGDDQGQEEFSYGFCSEFSITGAARKSLMMGATIQGRQVAPTSFTGAIAVPTVEEILFGKGILAIDAIGGTFGATVKSNTLLGMALNVKTGHVPLFAANGQIYFALTQQIAPEVSLDITFVHDASAAAQIVAYRAQTPQKLQVRFNGSAVTQGTAYNSKALIINLAGRWTKFTKIDEQDGGDVVTGTFRARYNATATSFASIIVVNALSALT